MDFSFRLGQLNRGIATAIIGLALLATAALVYCGQIDNATAAPGGIGPGTDASGTGPASNVKSSRFGLRTLREGMSGPDVRVLKSIVRSKKLLRPSALTETFDRPTTSAVRRFQGRANIASSGVVNRPTAKALVRSMGRAVATWYGPGFFGNMTACGKVRLRPGTIGVAHKTLPCGTKVLFGYRGKYIIAPVIDRGPYGAGRTWDLTSAVADAIGMTSAGVATVRHAVISRGK